MTYTYQTSGVCAKQMVLVINDDGIIEELQIVGGCDGNTQGLERLVVGREAAQVVGLLQGIQCREKATSCPDQLAHAIKEALGGIKAE